MIIITNPDAIAAKHGGPSGITTRDGVLTGWPDHIPYPTQADIDQWESEYVPPVDPDVDLDARIDGVDVSGITDNATRQALIDLKAAIKGKARGRK
jgi:hypothetical protein